MTSERKKEANRQNAKRSTGPKNTARTKFNALRHGLLCTAAVIEHGEAAEDPRELAALLEALRRDLKSVGALEDMLVDRIASCYWRLRRVQRAEVGETRQGADSATLDMAEAMAQRQHRLLVDEQLDPGIAGSWSRMLTTSLGIEHLRSVLREARTHIEEVGFLQEDQLRKLVKVLGLRDGTLGDWLGIFSTIAAQGSKPDPDSSEEWAISPEACKKTMLRLIDDELKALEGMGETIAEREDLRQEAALLSRHLPDPRALEKIVRYEAAIERQLYRALNELKALQAARREDNGKRQR